MPLKLHTPGTFAQGTLELQFACVLAHVPIEEQSLAPRHVTELSLAQWPRISGHVPGFALHEALGGLLQVPSVRHCALPVQGCCDHG
jgi:hypothetical protein